MPPIADVQKESDAALSRTPGFPHYFWAALGSVFIGVTLPCVLVSLRTLGKPPGGHGAVLQPFEMFLIATIFCGPGAVVLSIILLVLLATIQKRTLSRVMIWGAFLGIWMAFFNFPAHFVSELLLGDSHMNLRISVLFAVAGLSCGLWIAWVTWRVWNPNERFFPRFSLRTLILLVILWGGVMAVFQPRAWPKPAPHGER